MGQIIGITGAIGSGKSTLAALLCDTEPSHARYESGELIAEVAEDFNRALSGELAFETTTDSIELVNQALIWFIEAVSEKLHRELTWNQLAITKQQLAEHPELFEKMFTYIKTAQKHPEILDIPITSANKETYRPLLQWLGGYLVAKVGSTVWYDEIFRHINQRDTDKNLILIGGLRYPSDAEAVRKHGGIILSVQRPSIAADTTDITESSRELIEPDITILNTGSLDELRTVAEQLWNDLGAGKPQQNYNAHP